MATKHAMTLSDQQLAVLLAHVTKTSPRPLVDRAAFLLSFKAGLRAQEIAGLRWDAHILDASGAFRTDEHLVPGAGGRVKRVTFHTLFVGSDIGKYGNERTLRMHDDIVAVLKELYAARDPNDPYVIPSGKGWAGQEIKQRAHALAMRLNRAYDKIGFEKCSSHSGRRTFITKAAQRANLVGCSLKDVQALAGHKDLTTTERYIDVSPSQADLVALL